MWDFIKITYPKAAKPHRCEECEGVIAPCERHAYHAGKVEGEFTSYRLCEPCSDLASAWCWKFDDGEGFPLGDLRGHLAAEGITDLVGFVAEWKAKATADRIARDRAYREAGLAERAWSDVRAEHERVRTVEGWTAEHDDGHTHNELAMAGGLYAIETAGLKITPHPWPFDLSWWKPKTPRENLVRAAGFMISEIQRLDRAAAGDGEPS